jgi:hypothetical protein
VNSHIVDTRVQQYPRLTQAVSEHELSERVAAMVERSIPSDAHEFVERLRA